MIKNKDLNNTKWKYGCSENNTYRLFENVCLVIVGTLIITLFIAYIYTVSGDYEPVSISKSTECSHFAYMTDDLISPERAEFMVLFEHGETMDEGDMQ